MSSRRILDRFIIRRVRPDDFHAVPSRHVERKSQPSAPLDLTPHALGEAFSDLPPSLTQERGLACVISHRVRSYVSVQSDRDRTPLYRPSGLPPPRTPVRYLNYRRRSSCSPGVGTDLRSSRGFADTAARRRVAGHRGLPEPPDERRATGVSRTGCLGEPRAPATQLDRRRRRRPAAAALIRAAVAAVGGSGMARTETKSSIPS